MKLLVGNIVIFVIGLVTILSVICYQQFYEIKELKEQLQRIQIVTCKPIETDNTEIIGIISDTIIDTNTETSTDKDVNKNEEANKEKSLPKIDPSKIPHILPNWYLLDKKETVESLTRHLSEKEHNVPKYLVNGWNINQLRRLHSYLHNGYSLKDLYE